MTPKKPITPGINMTSMLLSFNHDPSNMSMIKMNTASKIQNNPPINANSSIRKLK
jgi:hypothetical protein